MATGAGRQLAAQHSHSLEGWYAHIPGHPGAGAGRRSQDARWHARPRRWPIPNPVLIFEHMPCSTTLEGELDPDVTGAATSAAPQRCAGRRHATSASITYGNGSLPKVPGRRRGSWRPPKASPPRSIDLRVLRPLDMETIDRLGGASTHKARRDRRRRLAERLDLAAEVIAARHGRGVRSTTSTRRCARVCSRGSTGSLCRETHGRGCAAAASSKIVAAARALTGAALRRVAEMIEFKLPSLGADMDEGKLLEWKVSPGDTVKKGQVVAIVDTSKAAVDVESGARALSSSCWSSRTRRSPSAR
jgi:hypothetical protein